MSKRNVVGLILCLFVVFAAAFMSGIVIPMLINLPSALLIALGMTGAALFSHFPVQKPALRWRAAACGAWYSGVVVFTVSIVALLNNLADPSTIGPNLSVALLSILYGAAAAFVCHIISLRKTAVQ